MKTYIKSLILLSISIIMVFTASGCNNTNVKDNFEAEDVTIEQNENPYIETVKVEADSEIGQEILKMDEYMFGEENKYNEPVLLNKDELIGAWSISGALIELFPNGRFQYFMTDAKIPVRCQIGTYTYEAVASNEGSDIDSTYFVLNIEHIIIDDKVTKMENLVIPYTVTGLKENDDLAVLNLNSIQVSEFDKLSNDLKDPLLNVENFQEISMDEMQKLFDTL